MVKKYDKDSREALSGHFNVYEFRCPCTECDFTLIDPDLVVRLESLRGQAGRSLKITSGYRCAAYQADLKSRGYETSTGPSQHEAGRAADVTTTGEGRLSGEGLETAARAVGFTSVGVGKTFIHVDLRPGYRRWTYGR